jgi:hypothetical protein
MVLCVVTLGLLIDDRDLEETVRMKNSEDGDSRFLLKIGIHQKDYTLSHSRSLLSEHGLP